LILLVRYWPLESETMSYNWSTLKKLFGCIGHIWPMHCTSFL